MRPAKAVKLGEEFLKGISGEELRSTQMREKTTRSRPCCRRLGTGRKECS